MISARGVARIEHATGAATREVHAVADHVKRGRVATAPVCEVKGMAGVISDAAAAAAMVVALQGWAAR